VNLQITLQIIIVSVSILEVLLFLPIQSLLCFLSSLAERILNLVLGKPLLQLSLQFYSYDYQPVPFTKPRLGSYNQQILIFASPCLFFVEAAVLSARERIPCMEESP
jgi:hypothetical protein